MPAQRLKKKEEKKRIQNDPVEVQLTAKDPFGTFGKLNSHVKQTARRVFF